MDFFIINRRATICIKNVIINLIPLFYNVP